MAEENVKINVIMGTADIKRSGGRCRIRTCDYYLSISFFKKSETKISTFTY